MYTMLGIIAGVCLSIAYVSSNPSVNIFVLMLAGLGFGITCTLIGTIADNQEEKHK